MDIMKVSLMFAGVDLDDFNDLCSDRTLKKASSILTDPRHPLFNDVILFPSGHSYNLPKYRTQTLIPAACGFLRVFQL